MTRGKRRGGGEQREDEEEEEEVEEEEWGRAHLIEEELQLLIGKVDAGLFKTVVLEMLKPENIQDTLKETESLSKGHRKHAEKRSENYERTARA